MPKTVDADSKVLLLYELAAAAGGSKHPPVSPAHAKLVAKHAAPETLAAVERVYRAIERAMTDSRPDDTIDDVFARVRGILAKPH